MTNTPTDATRTAVVPATTNPGVRHGRTFTLTELLVVLAVIAVLLAVLLPGRPGGSAWGTSSRHFSLPVASINFDGASSRFAGCQALIVADLGITSLIPWRIAQVGLWYRGCKRSQHGRRPALTPSNERGAFTAGEDRSMLGLPDCSNEGHDPAIYHDEPGEQIIFFRKNIEERRRWSAVAAELGCVPARSRPGMVSRSVPTTVNLGTTSL